MNIYPYVYRLDHPITGEFYIGYRSANKVPAEQDLGHKYFTSSKIVKPRFHEFEYQITAEFFDKSSAYEFEQILLRENWGNGLLLNRNISGKMFKEIDYSSIDYSYRKGKPTIFNTDNPSLKIHNIERMINNNPMHNLGVRQKVSVTIKSKWELNSHEMYIKGKYESKDRNDKIRNNMSGELNPNYNNPKASAHLNRDRNSCPHCGIITTKGNLVRWHNDNCKHKT